MSFSAKTMEIEIGGEKRSLTRKNTAVITHASGQTALGGVLMDNSRFDHIMNCHCGSENGTGKGMAIFREAGGLYEDLEQELIESGYSQFDSLTAVSDATKEMYLDYLAQTAKRATTDLGDYLPQNFDAA